MKGTGHHQGQIIRVLWFQFGGYLTTWVLRILRLDLLWALIYAEVVHACIRTKGLGWFRFLKLAPDMFI